MTNVAPSRDCLPGHRQVAADDPIAHRRIPFVVLSDVALDDRDAHRVARRCERAFRDAPAAPDRGAGDEARNDHGDGPAPLPLVHDNECHGGGREREQEREAVDAGHARQLSDRQHRDLTVAEQRPGKAVPDVLAAELACHPDRRGAQDRGAHTKRPAEAERRPRQTPRERATDRRRGAPRRAAPPEWAARRTSSSSRPASRAFRRSRPAPVSETKEERTPRPSGARSDVPAQ